MPLSGPPHRCCRHCRCCLGRRTANLTLQIHICGIYPVCNIRSTRRNACSLHRRPADACIRSRHSTSALWARHSRPWRATTERATMRASAPRLQTKTARAWSHNSCRLYWSFRLTVTVFIFFPLLSTPYVVLFIYGSKYFTVREKVLTI